jgi:hypothetical protein
MKIEGAPFATTDFTEVPATRHAGDVGFALWRTVEAGNVRIRMVEYSPGYFADHWCARGHVMLVLEGELVTELQDGRSVTLTPGMSYHVGENTDPHRSHTEKGARLFIVD